METVATEVGCPIAVTNNPFSQNFLTTGNMTEAMATTIVQLKSAKLRGQTPGRVTVVGLRYPSQTPAPEIRPSAPVLLGQNGLVQNSDTAWDRRLDAEPGLENTLPACDDGDNSQWLLSPMAHANATTFTQLQGRPPVAARPQLTNEAKRVPATLRECYDQTLLEQSMHGGENGMRFSVQLERPLVWVDTSTDPKYACAGWDVTAYTAWKDAAEKRKAQGAPQRFVTYISINMVDVICAMLRVSPLTVMNWSDEELVHKLDTKFNIAQETNLLLMKFTMPTRPPQLPIWELHLPSLEWSKYVAKWLKELRSQMEGGKDLEKYDLSDVFTQSLTDFKMMYDHARVLTKLPVRDLIASCSDFLQEQVINEQRTANARKQQGILLDFNKANSAAPPLGGVVNVSKVLDPKTGFLPRRRAFNQGASGQGEYPPPGPRAHGAFGQGEFPMGPRTPARALLTEAVRPPAPPPPRYQPAGAPADCPQRGLVPCKRMPEHDVDCNGCGRFYKNFPDRRFPFPCHEKCQYTGHPLCTNKTKRWPFPGFCCSWKGMEDTEIPAEALARLQKYKALKRDRQL